MLSVAEYSVSVSPGPAVWGARCLRPHPQPLLSPTPPPPHPPLPLRSLENTEAAAARLQQSPSPAGKAATRAEPTAFSSSGCGGGGVSSGPHLDRTQQDPLCRPHPDTPSHRMVGSSGMDTDPQDRRINTAPFTDDYTVEGEIGRGKFAVVKRCKHRATSKIYAAKFLRKRRKGQDCRHDILHEIRMLETALLHPRLVDLVEVYETSHELIIVTEYAAGGELFTVVRDEEQLPEPVVVRLMRQVLDGLNFLHQRQVVHLDVKPQNILLTGALPGCDVKLCDFGFARTVLSGEDVRDIIGTPDFVAPEILSYDPIRTASDIWSVGVLAYVLLTGCSPFEGDTKQETFMNISQVNLDFPVDLFTGISAEAINFIQTLLNKEPSERPTAAACLAHPWLATPASPLPRPDLCTPTRSPFGSPLGQRRALTPPSPDCLTDEPIKKCKCDATENRLSVGVPGVSASEDRVNATATIESVSNGDVSNNVSVVAMTTTHSNNLDNRPITCKESPHGLSNQHSAIVRSVTELSDWVNGSTNHSSLKEDDSQCAKSEVDTCALKDLTNGVNHAMPLEKQDIHLPDTTLPASALAQS